MKNLFTVVQRIIFLLILLQLFGCGQKSAESRQEENGLTKVTILMDWYPQPEHGGFYQALATGLYKKAGLDVEIRPGGGIRDIRPLVALGQVDFAVGTSDTTLIGITRGLPLQMLAPYFLHDPQCVMFHPELNISKLEDLDNKVVMLLPSQSHTEYLTKIMKLNLNLIPLDYSISRFATDKSFVQQCFVSSEPVHLREKGINPSVIPLSESGFDPYRLIYTSSNFLEASPEVAKAFVEASIEGWRSFMFDDPKPALDAILKVNPQQDMRLMELAMEEMKKYKLVSGNAYDGEQLGVFQKERLFSQIEALKIISLIKNLIDSPYRKMNYFSNIKIYY